MKGGQALNALVRTPATRPSEKASVLSTLRVLVALALYRVSAFAGEWERGREGVSERVLATPVTWRAPHPQATCVAATPALHQLSYSYNL